MAAKKLLKTGISWADKLRQLGLNRWHVAIGVGIGGLTYLLWFFQVSAPRSEAYRLLGQLYLPLPEAFLCRFVGSYERVAWNHFALLDRVPLLLVAAALLVSATAAGWLALPHRIRQRLTPLEQGVFAAGLGLQLQSLYTLAIGLLGALHYAWLLIVPMVLVSAGSGWRLWRMRPSGKQVRQQLRAIASWPRQLAFWLLLPVISLLLLMAALPPWEFDVREYHLQVPKEWFLQGSIGFLPHNVYGNMPLGGEMHALSAMMLCRGPLAWWYGALAGKILMASVTLIAAAGLYCFGRRFHSPRSGLIAAVIYLSTPWILHVSCVGLVEGVLAAYMLLACYAVMLWWQGDEHTTDAQRLTARGDVAFLGLGGALAGAAVSTKYTGLLLVAAPLLVWILIAAPAPRWRPLLVYCSLALASGGLWYAKNAMLAGNPTYPLLYSVWGGRQWDEVTDQRWRKAHGPQADADGRQFSWRQLRTALADVTLVSDKLSPLLWPLAAFTVLIRRRWMTALALLLLANFLLWWLMTHRYDRFFVPMLPLVALLAGCGACWTDERNWKLSLNWLISGIVALSVLVVCTGVLTGDNRIWMRLDWLRTDKPQELLERMHPTHLLLNQLVPPGKKALLVAEAQVFDFEVPIYYSTCWNPCVFETWLRGKSRDEQLRVLAEHGVSHVLIRWDELARYRSPGNYGFPADITHDWVHDELVQRHGILKPLPVIIEDVQYVPSHGEVFEVIYENSHAAAVDRR